MRAERRKSKRVEGCKGVRALGAKDVRDDELDRSPL